MSNGKQAPARHMSDGQAPLMTNVIDLRSSPPPRAVVQRTNDPASNRTSQEIVLPRWQPDEEVLNCPICWTKFNFWHRKHHCRYVSPLVRLMDGIELTSESSENAVEWFARCVHLTELLFHDNSSSVHQWISPPTPIRLAGLST